MFYHKKSVPTFLAFALLLSTNAAGSNSSKVMPSQDEVVMESLPLPQAGVAQSPSEGALTLRQKIGQMIMIGFEGTTPEDSQVKTLSQRVTEGDIGGIIYFAYNLKDKPQVTTLTHHFKSLNTPDNLPLLQCVDQEGGRVQRLSEKNGFSNTPSAYQVAQTQTHEQAHKTYSDMALMVHSAGFNCVFGPVVDLAYDPTSDAEIPKQNPVIGGLERAFSHDPNIVSDYARIFVDAHRKQGIATSAKHCPGHGLAPSDTHHDLTDITKTYKEDVELAPYLNLMASNHIDMVMTAHVMHQDYDHKYPATLSPVIIKKLLRDKGFNGVVVTDDLFMGAIQKHYSLEEIVLKAIEADVDILLFSINHAAQKGVNANEIKPMEGKVVDDIINIIVDAIDKGVLTEDRIERSFQRIQRLKAKLAPKSA